MCVCFSSKNDPPGGNSNKSCSQADKVRDSIPRRGLSGEYGASNQNVSPACQAHHHSPPDSIGVRVVYPTLGEIDKSRHKRLQVERKTGNTMAEKYHSNSERCFRAYAAKAEITLDTFYSRACSNTHSPFTSYIISPPPPCTIYSSPQTLHDAKHIPTIQARTCEHKIKKCNRPSQYLSRPRLHPNTHPPSHLGRLPRRDRHRT